MAEQIGGLYEQLGDLKNRLGSLLEENHGLTSENRHLRNRLDAETNEDGSTDDEEQVTNKTRDIPGEGYDDLARSYEEGFHICKVHFGVPREEADYIVWL